MMSLMVCTVGWAWGEAVSQVRFRSVPEERQVSLAFYQQFYSLCFSGLQTRRQPGQLEFAEFYKSVNSAMRQQKKRWRVAHSCYSGESYLCSDLFETSPSSFLTACISKCCTFLCTFLLGSLTKQRAPVVAQVNPVRIHHGNNLHDSSLEKDLLNM